MQNIALWLLVFVILGLIYKNFGPESPNPMFTLPEGMRPFTTDFMAEKKEKASSTNSPSRGEGVDLPQSGKDGVVVQP